jgi:hypothetical protein
MSSLSPSLLAYALSVCYDDTNLPFAARTAARVRKDCDSSH